MGTSEDTPLAEARQLVYEASAGKVGLEGVHWLLARHGPAILDRGLPYVIVAARHELAGRARRASSQREVLTATPPDEPSIWDPLERIDESDTLRKVIDALAALDNRDVVVIWYNAQGVSDEEIRAVWDELGLRPASPTVETIRQRRHRARARLRMQLGLDPPSS